MSEEKKERMRSIKAELDNLLVNSPVSPESVLSAAAMQECLRWNWAKKDSGGNFVPTDLGKAMAGREGET